MNPNQRHKKETSKNLIMVLIAIVATVMIYIALNSKEIKWAMMTQQERIDDLAGPQHTVPDEYEAITETNSSELEFEAENSAERWFEDFKSNRIKFDQKFQDSTINVFGTVSDIKRDWGCAIVQVQAGESAFDNINFSNCPEGKDKWENEVADIAVGQFVHFRGKYNATLSDGEMEFYKCHIIKPIK